MRGGRYLTVPHPVAGELFVGRERYVDTTLDMLDRPGRRRHDVEIENLRRQIQRGTGIRNINDAADMSLHGSNTQDRIGLCPGIAELLEILDRIQACLTIGDMNIEVMLLAALVDRDALEDQIVLVVRRDRRRLEYGILDAVFGNTILDDVDLEVQPARHFDGPTKGDLAVALAEMQIAHRETAAGHVDREVDLRTARQALDIAIAAMLARRHRSGAFGADLGLDISFGATGMSGRRKGRVGEWRHARF